MVFFALFPCLLGSQNASENEICNVREYHAFLAFLPSALALQLHMRLHLRLHTSDSLGFFLRRQFFRCYRFSTYFCVTSFCRVARNYNPSFLTSLRAMPGGECLAP